MTINIIPALIDWSALPLLLGEKEAAALIGVSISFLRKSRCEGCLNNHTPAPPFVPLGGRRYYRVSDLRDWVQGLTAREII